MIIIIFSSNRIRALGVVQFSSLDEGLECQEDMDRMQLWGPGLNAALRINANGKWFPTMVKASNTCGHIQGDFHSESGDDSAKSKWQKDATNSNTRA